MIDIKAVLAKAAAAKAAPPAPKAPTPLQEAAMERAQAPIDGQAGFDGTTEPEFIIVEADDIEKLPLTDEEFDAIAAKPGTIEMVSNAIPPLDIYNTTVGNLGIFKPIINEDDDPGPVPEENLVFLKAGFHIPSSPEVPVEEIVENAKLPNIPNATADPASEAEDNCAHMCESCDEWWSHGPRLKCRHPDILKQGLCMKCLNGTGKTENPDPVDGLVEDDRGRLTLAPSEQIKVRNKTREICRNMDIEQISHHIRYIYKTELEARAHNAEARKMRAELIDYEAQDIPEAEREAFKQALLLGKKTKEKKPAKVKLSKVEQKAALLAKITDDLKKSNVANPQLVAQYMLQIVGARDINDAAIYEKLRAKAEAFVND